MERQADRTAEKNRRPDVNMYLALFTRPGDWREEQRGDDSCEPLKREQAGKELGRCGGRFRRARANDTADFVNSRENR